MEAATFWNRYRTGFHAADTLDHKKKSRSAAMDTLYIHDSPHQLTIPTDRRSETGLSGKTSVGGRGVTSRTAEYTDCTTYAAVHRTYENLNSTRRRTERFGLEANYTPSTT